MCKSLPFSLGRYRVGARYAISSLARAAGTVAIVPLALATWASVPNAEEKGPPTGKTSDVENCDRTLGPTAPGLNFSGVFEGTVFDGGQSGVPAEVKLVRNGDVVQGSYFRGEICGSVSGNVISNRLEFSWKWAGNSGRGIASQTADRLSGTSGFGDDARGGGTFVLFQRRAGRPPAVWSAQGLFEASDLNKCAIELDNAGRYSDAEPLYKRELEISEKALGPDHPEVATALSNLAFLYGEQGRYSEAEPLYERALAIREKALGPDHPDVAVSLNNSAALHRDQGRYADAERLHRRALTIREKALGPNHPDVAVSLNNLAELYRAQARYAEAEPLYKRALAIWERSLGPDDPNPAVALSLNNLAEAYRAQARYADAEPLYKRSLETLEKALGPDHPLIATLQNNLASLYIAQGRYPDAEPRFPKVVGNIRKVTRLRSPNVAFSLNNLAELYRAQGRYADAEPLHKRALAIREQALGPEHLDVASSLNNLAGFYLAQGRYADALPFVKRTISQNSANKLIAFAILYGSENQKLIPPKEALNASYKVLQHAVSTAAGEAVSKLAACFAAGTNDLALLVRKDQDLTAEAAWLDKSIISAVSKPPAQRNLLAKDQIRRSIDEIKSERDKSTGCLESAISRLCRFVQATTAYN